MTKRHHVALIALILTPPTVATAQVLPNGAGKVEFIGLETWTPDRLRDKLTGGRNVAQIHYCAANLIEDAGMADASVMYHASEAGTPYVVVTVIEPEHRDRVQYLTAPAGTSQSDPEWAPLAKVTEGRSLGAQMGVIHYASSLRNGRDATLATLSKRAERSEVLAVWDLLERFDTDADRERAIAALQKDPLPANRQAAATILINFGAHDLTWWTLVRGLRDSDQAVRSTCNQALLSLTRAGAHAVDWKPAVDDLRHLLAGTNLFAFPHLLETLAATEIASELAGPLLHENARLVLAYLGAENGYERQRAHAFLSRISGDDHGPEPADWQDWVDSLTSDA